MLTRAALRPWRAAVATAALACTACTGVTVSPTSGAPAATPRPRDCAVDFLRTRLPERPYDELGEVHVKVPAGGESDGLEAMRGAACALGADAVIVTDAFAWKRMAGVAIRYRAP
jgi:hypothetical protein